MHEKLRTIAAIVSATAAALAFFYSRRAANDARDAKTGVVAIESHISAIETSVTVIKSSPLFNLGGTIGGAQGGGGGSEGSTGGGGGGGFGASGGNGGSILYSTPTPTPQP